jgi:hypothetical protein
MTVRWFELSPEQQLDNLENWFSRYGVKDSDVQRYLDRMAEREIFRKAYAVKGGAE